MIVDEVGEVPPLMWGAMAAIAVVILTLGVYPRVAYPLLDNATALHPARARRHVVRR